MRRRPAVRAVAHIRRHALLAGHRDQVGHKALLDRVVNLGQPHHRRADALRDQRQSGLFRTRGSEASGQEAHLPRSRAARRQERDPAGDEQGSVGALKRGAERLNGTPVQLAVSANFEKSWLKARWMTPSEAAAPPRQAVQIFKRPEMRLGPCGNERLGARLRRVSPST